MIMGNRDPLQEALSAKKSQSFYNIPISHGNFFKTRKFDLEHLGMSFTQRVFAFVICLCLGAVLFFYSLTTILFSIGRPTAFGFPYALSNTLFFFMFGFLSGFRTYFGNLFSKSKRVYTIAFMSATVFTLYVSFTKIRHFFKLLSAILQVITFSGFVITFLPGGSAGLTSLINLFIKG